MRSADYADFIAAAPRRPYHSPNFQRGLWRNDAWDEAGATSFPPLLPGDNGPSPARNAYGNVWRVLLALLG